MTETETTALIAVQAADYGLAEAEATTIAAAFAEHLEQMVGLEPAYREIVAAEITPEVCQAARHARLRYVKIRTGTAATHKQQKAYYLAGGRYVDAWRAAQHRASEEREAELLAIEEHFERIEAERIAALEAERWDALAPYVDTKPAGLGAMDDDTFVALIKGAKMQHEERLRAAAEAEARRVEAERQEREERARIAEENARLRAEAEQAAAALRAEQERARAEAAKLRAEAEAERRKIEQLRADALAADIERRRAEAPPVVEVDEPTLFGDGATVLVSELTERQAGQRDVVEWMRAHGLVKAAAAAERYFNLV